jgi:hypothetical protein
VGRESAKAGAQQHQGFSFLAKIFFQVATRVEKNERKIKGVTESNL